MTAFEKLCKMDDVVQPFDYANKNCPFDADINLDQPDDCPLFGSDWTREDNLKCVACWMREADNNCAYCVYSYHGDGQLVCILTEKEVDENHVCKNFE